MNHLIDREPVGKAFELKSWPLAEASLTPNPCEPRNVAISLKSWEPQSFAALLEEMASGDPAVKAAPAEQPALVDDAAASASPQETILEALEALPFKQYLETMGAIASDCDRRLSWYDTERSTKQGRPISGANLAAMQTIHDGLLGHVGQLKSIIDRHSAPGADADTAAMQDDLGGAYAQFLYLRSQPI